MPILRGGGRGGRRTEAGPSGDGAKVNGLYHAQLEELTHAGAAKQEASGEDSASIFRIYQGPNDQGRGVPWLNGA